MKIRFLVLALTLVFVFGMIGSPAQAASTPIYLGQTTWTVTITASDQSPPDIGQSFTVTGGITRVGDIYYLFEGYRTTTPPDNPGVISGGGVLLNGQLILNISDLHLQTNGNRYAWVLQLTLNQSNLNGSYYGIQNLYNGTVVQHFSAGTLTRTGPAINLTPGVLAGPTSLLLE